MNTHLNSVFATCLLVLAFLTAGDAKAEATSNIKDDESVVFFRTTAWLSPDGKTWNVPVHGWIYEPQNSKKRKALAAKTLEDKYGLVVSEETRANFDRRLNLMIADNERGKQIVVNFGDRTHTLPESESNGHFGDILELPAADAEKLAVDHVITFSAATRSAGGRRFLGQVRLIPPGGVSVISDIDDTVKISHVTDHAKLFDYTFYRDFEPVPGMAELYRDWSAKAMTVHFVSSSPYQLYTPLRQFANDAGFPWASFSLKYVRFRDETLLNLFRKGTETKPEQIEPILERYPGRRFILLGDSGEQDPEVYADIFRRYPDRIEKIYIRNITGGSRNDERFSAVFDGIPAEYWTLFDDPSTIGTRSEP